MEREIKSLRDWLTEVDGKVDLLIKDGCAHRGNDLAKLDRVEKAASSVQSEAMGIRQSVYELSLNFERHKTDMVASSGVTDTKISGIKIWVLINALLLAVGILGYVASHFVIPAIKN